MKFSNTPQLKEWLERDHPELAIQTKFELDAAAYQAFRKQLHSQGDHKDPRDRQKEAEALNQAALFVALTYQGPKKPVEGERYAHDRQRAGSPGNGDRQKPAEACQVIN